MSTSLFNMRRKGGGNIRFVDELLTGDVRVS